MQNKVKIFHLILFLPVLFWLVAKPISLTSAQKADFKTEKHTSKSHKPSGQNQTVVYAEQHIYQVCSNLQMDFPSDWVLKDIVFVSIKLPLQGIKLPTIPHRTQWLRILLTQFISTLAP